MDNGSNDGQKELKAMLQRQMSGRSLETTFEAPEHDINIFNGSDDVSGENKLDVKERESLLDNLKKAGHRAIGGGLPGAAAMGIQVTSLMWMRTTMNYQYRHGTSTVGTLKHLYREGGVRRFYRGYGAAILQGPLSRFGDTAANAGMLSLLDSNESTASLAPGIKTVAASVTAALFRICLMPIDTVKTILQVEGKNGLSVLRGKIVSGGPQVMWAGSLGAASATFVGHYPWFATYNTLQVKIPKFEEHEVAKSLARNALIGFCSSVVSDCTSNSIRVIKTTKQTYEIPIGYPKAVSVVLEKDGLQGLFLRGLGTRILTNGMQGMMFSVLWKYFEKEFAKR